MDQNTEFLNYIYQNSQMGITSIEQLTDKVEDKEFNDQLRNQLHEYQEINKAALESLRQNGHEEKDIPKMQEIGAHMSIAMKTLTDHSPEHISEMMLQGSTMGIIDVTKNIKKYPDAPKETKELAERLLKTEENNFQRLKAYLG